MNTLNTCPWKYVKLLNTFLPISFGEDSTHDLGRSTPLSPAATAILFALSGMWELKFTEAMTLFFSVL